MARRIQRPAGGRISDEVLTAAFIFAVALGLRVAYFLSIHHAAFFDQLQTNAARYHQWATLILNGPRAPQPPFDQPPGYPYFVAAVYAIFGRHVAAVALVQAVLDALSCLFIAYAARQWFGRRAGIIAGVLAAAYGPLIYFTGEMLPPTLFICVATAAMAAALRTPPAWVVASGLWALALVIRSEIALAFPLIVLDAWNRGERPGLWRTAAPLALVMCGFLAINAAHSPELVVLTTGDGLNLWLGNNPHADGVNPFVSGPLQAVAEGIRAKAVDGADADRMFRARAVDFWRDEPGKALRLLWKKFVWTWTNRELPNTSDIDWQTAHSWVFRLPFFPLRFGMILPLAAVGAALFRNQWRRLSLLISLVVIGVGTSVVFFTNARFRLIMTPALVLLAAAALDQLPRMLRAWHDNLGTIALAVAATAVGAVGAWGNFYDVRSYRISEIAVNTGILEREGGELQAAVEHLRQGLADNPHDSIGWIHLALALEQQGHIDQALRDYLDALALMPDDTLLRQMAARFFERHRIDASNLTNYLTAPDQKARNTVAEQLRNALKHSPGNAE